MKKSNLLGTQTARTVSMSALFLVVGIVVCASTSQAQSVAQTPTAPKSNTVITKKEWKTVNKEKGSKFKCEEEYPNSFLIGRRHKGDENQATGYLCGTATQFGKPVTISDHKLSDNVKESDHEYNCPTNTIMTGREHDGDENKATRYQCAKATGPMGDLQVTPEEWSDPQIESASEFECTDNTVLVARKHYGDENQSTWHKCARLW